MGESPQEKDLEKTHDTHINGKKVCQNAHLHYFTYKAPTFTSWGFVIT